MTKLIRIENADLSQYKVKVSVFDRLNGDGPGMLAEQHNLDSPCAMKNIHIHKGRYLVIEEYEPE